MGSETRLHIRNDVQIVTELEQKKNKINFSFQFFRIFSPYFIQKLIFSTATVLFAYFWIKEKRENFHYKNDRHQLYCCFFVNVNL